MSITVMNMVWNTYPHPGAARMALLLLANYANDQGGSIWPSMTTISRQLAVDRRAAQRAIRQLEEQGVIEVVGNHSGGNRNESRNYQINLNKIANPTTGGQITTGGQMSTPRGGQNDTYGWSVNHPKEKKENITKTKTAPKKQTNKATRIDPDLELSNEWKTWAEKKRPELDAQKVFDSFKDWFLSAPGAKGLKNSWIATWRIWVTRQEVKPYNKAYEDPTNDYRYYVQPEVHDNCEDPFGTKNTNV